MDLVEVGFEARIGAVTLRQAEKLIQIGRPEIVHVPSPALDARLRLGAGRAFGYGRNGTISAMSVPILHQDDWLLAVNKPAGLATVPGGWEKDAPSLVKLLEADYGRLWTVHRLDKITSGVIVFARNAEAHRTLSLLFESRAVVKTYHAFVCGTPKWDEHTARHPLRINVGHSHRTVVDHGKGKPAETRFRVLERFAVPAPDRGYALLEAKPATGRTHQVRAHLAALGFPLLTDTLYGAPIVGRDVISPLQRSAVEQDDISLIQRPALHAFSLEFEFNGTPFSFTAPYPDDFAQTLQDIRAS